MTMRWIFETDTGKGEELCLARGQALLPAKGVS